MSIGGSFGTVAFVPYLYNSSVSFYRRHVVVYHLECFEESRLDCAIAPLHSCWILAILQTAVGRVYKA